MSAPLLSRLFDPDHRDDRIALQKALIVSSLLVFMLSLFLPAVSVHLEDGMDGTVGRGVQCLVMSKPYYPSNLLLFTGPLWCWVLRRRRGPTLGAMMTILAVLSLIFVVIAPTMAETIYPLFGEGYVLFLSGYYVWILAHLLMTLAIALPLWGDHQREELQQLRGELEALERKWAPTSKAA